MAATDATHFPVKNQAFRLTVVFTLITTGKESSGALTALAASVSKDGGAASAATASPTQQGTTGLVTLDLTATEMNADTVVVRFTSSLANTVDCIVVLRPIDLSEVAGRADSHTVKKYERFTLQNWRRWFNQRSQVRSTGAYTQYMADNTTVDVSGTVSAGIDTVTAGKNS
jgi:hypothetical protein